MESPVAKIGKQIWMKENLDVDHFRNGEKIREVKSDLEWEQAGLLKEPAWCYFNNKPFNYKYGKLYNWYAIADPRGLAPEGWHIPNKTDFEILCAAVRENGNALKAVGQGTKDGAGTDQSGFSALLAGNREGNSGHFGYAAGNADFWSSTESNATAAYYMNLGNYGSKVRLGSSSKTNGCSVRCIKD